MVSSDNDNSPPQTKGLTAYLENAEVTAALVDWLHEETNIPKLPLSLIVRHLGGFLGRAAGRHIAGLVEKSATLRSWQAKVEGSLARLDEKEDAKQKFQAILDGQQSANVAEFTRALPLDLQAHFQELEKLDELGDELRAGLARIESRLNPQPPLSLYVREQTKRDRFKFETRWVPFIGREREMTELDTFLDTDVPFSWWLAVGEAGAGKSRLALEFALQRGMSWRIGFLKDSWPKTWTSFHDWQPEQPTVIVSDYAFRDPEALHDLADALSSRIDLDCPVRLLLLDRQAEGQWLEKFLGTKDRYRRSIEDHRFKSEPLRLEALESQNLETLLNVSISKAGSTAQAAQVVEAAQQLVHLGGRPLFAAFAADAMAQGKDPRDWDKNALVDDVLKREMDRWRDAGARDEDMTLLAFATMTGGLSAEEAGKAVEDAGGILPGLDKRTARVHSFMSGGPADALKPLEPDILGEVFVLKWLSPESGLAAQVANERIDVLRKLAWRFSPLGMFGFLTRTATDFPEHSLFAELARPTEENEKQRMYWSMAATNLIGRIGSKQQEVVASLYEAQKNLATEYREPTLREQQANGAYNLLTCLGEAGELEPAHAFYRELAILVCDHPKEPTLREKQANGAYNLMTCLAHAGEHKRAEVHYRVLAVLASDYPEEPVLRKWQANGATNLIAGLGGTGELEPAHTLYQELATLVSDHPEEAGLLESQAMGAYNLLTALGEAGALDRADALYRELAVLASKHPEVAVLREQQANGVVNFISALGSAGEHELAHTLYRELVVLVSEHPEEVVLRKQQAKGAYNLLSGYLRAGELELAYTLYRELATIPSIHPEDPALLESQANGAYNLLTCLSNAGERERAQVLYEELAVLASEHPEEAVLREPQAKGAYNLLSGYLKAGELESAHALYRELAILASGHPEESTLREPQARGAVNCIVSLGESGNLRDADSIYQELVVLARNYPTEYGLAERRLRGGIALIKFYIHTNQLVAARQRQAELLRVCENIPGTPRDFVDQLQNMVPVEQD